jgi:hypothetical protein
VDFQGKKKHVPGGGWKTVREAKEACIKFVQELIEGYIEPSKMTFEEHSEQYFNNYGKIKLKPHTLSSMISRMNRYIYPVIDHIHLKDLKSDHIGLFQKSYLIIYSVINH